MVEAIKIKFPIEVLKVKVIKVFEKIGFRLVREGNHISMTKENPDGANMPITIPNHPRNVAP
jgi:predicted RNA binding protein YcfA (HicA-like mRNA interferase family)